MSSSRNNSANTNYNAYRQYLARKRLNNPQKEFYASDKTYYRENNSSAEYEESTLPYYVVPVLYVPQRILPNDQLSQSENYYQYQVSPNVQNGKKPQVYYEDEYVEDTPLSDLQPVEDPEDSTAYHNCSYYNEFYKCSSTSFHDESLVLGCEEYETTGKPLKSFQTSQNQQNYQESGKIRPISSSGCKKTASALHQYTRDDWYACQERRMTEKVPEVSSKLSGHYSKDNYDIHEETASEIYLEEAALIAVGSKRSKGVNVFISVNKLSKTTQTIGFPYTDNSAEKKVVGTQTRYSGNNQMVRSGLTRLKSPRREVLMVENIPGESVTTHEDMESACNKAMSDGRYSTNSKRKGVITNKQISQPVFRSNTKSPQRVGGRSPSPEITRKLFSK